MESRNLVERSFNELSQSMMRTQSLHQHKGLKALQCNNVRGHKQKGQSPSDWSHGEIIVFEP